MSTEIESMRERLEGAELASEVVRAPDGNISIVAHSNRTAADRALTVVAPVLERLRLARNGAHALEGVHRRRANRLRRELNHAKAALAGDNEGIRKFMADHEQRVERLKEQARLADVAERDAEAEVDRLRAERDALKAAIEGAAEAIQAAHRIMATSSHDWSQHPSDAWLYALLVGWECELPEHADGGHDEIDCDGPNGLERFAERFGWTEGGIAKLRAQRRAIAALDASQRPEDTREETP